MRDQEKIAELYQQLYTSLYSYAYCSLSSVSLAEEAVQETFIIVCMKEDAVLSSKNPQGWVFNTLKNVIRNTIRQRDIRQRITNNYIDQHSDEIVSTEDEVKLELLYEDLAELDAFTLLKEYAVDQKSYLEIAQERNITVANCRKMVQRAKERLKKHFK